MVLFLNKLSRFLSALGSLSDEEGTINAFLIANAAKITNIQNVILKMSSTAINTDNHGYTLRMISKALKVVGATAVAGCRYVADEYRKFREDLDIDQFEIWDASGDKTEINCVLESDTGARTEIGAFQMDLDAPCSVMRLYLRHFLRDALNEVTGDSFLFFGVIDDSETILDRESEESTESRLYVDLKIEDFTERRLYTVSITRDKATELMHIPEFTKVDNKIETVVDEPVLDTSMSAHYM